MLNRQPVIVVVIALVFLVGTMGVAAAQQGEGPPDELPSPVPDFVSDVLGTISDFVSSVITTLGDVLRAITPGGAGG